LASHWSEFSPQIVTGKALLAEARQQYRRIIGERWAIVEQLPRFGTRQGPAPVSSVQA
jgi:hypothetical protein